MARRGRGGGKRGPDLSWDDEEDDPSTYNRPNKPEPQFPPIELPVPRPISALELSCVKSYLRFRDRARNGAYYSVLDPSSLADVKTGKVIKRAGFDPFNDQEKYSAKYYKKKRTVPDLSGRDYELRYFPPELWPFLDPKRKHPLWKSTDIDFDFETNAPRKKRKRDIVIDEDVNEDEENHNDEGNDTDGSDPLLSGTRRSRNSTKSAKRRRDDLTTRKAGEKRGLDAEDEFSEEEIQPRPRRKKDKNKGSDDEDDDEDDDNADANDNDDGDDDDDDDGSGDDEPVDSEFEESDDGGGDDYNAENYFDTGEGDDEDGFAYGGGRGGDDDGAYF